MTSAAMPDFQHNPRRSRRHSEIAREHLGQIHVADAAECGDAEHPGHLQQLRIGGPDAAQQIGIEDRQDDQEGDQHRQILGGKQDQRQNDKGGHRNGLDGQEGWRQQLLHPAEPGGQCRQQGPGCYSQQETRCDAHQEYPMAPQKSSVGTSSVSRASTVSGETRMMR